MCNKHVRIQGKLTIPGKSAYLGSAISRDSVNRSVMKQSVTRTLVRYLSDIVFFYTQRSYVQNDLRVVKNYREAVPLERE